MISINYILFNVLKNITPPPVFNIHPIYYYLCDEGSLNLKAQDQTQALKTEHDKL